MYQTEIKDFMCFMFGGFFVSGLPKSKVSDLTVMPKKMQCLCPVCKSGRVFPGGLIVNQWHANFW